MSGQGVGLVRGVGVWSEGWVSGQRRDGCLVRGVGVWSEGDVWSEGLGVWSEGVGVLTAVYLVGGSGCLIRGGLVRGGCLIRGGGCLVRGEGSMVEGMVRWEVYGQEWVGVYGQGQCILLQCILVICTFEGGSGVWSMM